MSKLSNQSPQSSVPIKGLEDLEILPKEELEEPASVGAIETLDKDVAALVKDRPWIRQAAWLYAKGNGKEDIAEACGVNPHAISLVLGTKGFRKLASEFMVSTGSRAGVQRQITRAAMEAFMNIMFLAGNAQSEQVRLKANQDILDRALGKAPQITKQEVDEVPTDPLEEARKLDQQILEATKLFKQEGILIEQALKDTKI